MIFDPGLVPYSADVLTAVVLGLAPLEKTADSDKSGAVLNEGQKLNVDYTKKRGTHMWRLLTETIHERYHNRITWVH
jgi:hypothetical protein